MDKIINYKNIYPMKIKLIALIVIFFVIPLETSAQENKFKFDNQSNNVEVSTSTIMKVNIVCSSQFDYKIRLIPDEGIGKIHMRLIAPRVNKVLYDNAKDGYRLQKILKIDKSLVVMLEVQLVETEEDEDNEDFVSHGWLAMLVQNRLKTK